MKNLKKILALALAVILTLSLCTVSLAADADLTGHTYKAYQIFSGTQAADSAELGNIEWGSGINSSAFLTALIADTTIGSNFNANMSAKDVAEVVAKWADDSANAKAFARVAENNKKGNGAEPGETLDAGYYLVVDMTASVPVEYTPEGEEEAITGSDIWNLALLQLTKKSTFAIKTKVEVPESTKKIVETEEVPVEGGEEGETEEVEKLVEVNEAGIGDTITYEITGTIPASAAEYDYYYFIINDTMSAGLTFGEITSVQIDGEDVDYSAKTGDDAAPYTFQIALQDAKSNFGKTVVVRCTATLNENAVAGVAETNTEKVTYSNKPDFEYDGTTDETKPGFPDSKTNVPTGETPEQKVETYTTKLIVTKVDENGDILTGAEFTLTGDTNKIKVSTSTVFVENEEGKGAYYGLKGDTITYTTEAPEEDHMEPAPEGATDGYVVADPGTTWPGMIEVGDITYRVVNNGETPAYILVEGNADLYDGKTYDKEIKTTVMGDGEDVTDIKAYVNEDGIVSFEGLGAGNYVLTESATPAGYNTIDPIEFEVFFDASSKTFSTDNTDITLNGATNALETTIKNEKGSTLPETGGIGTTIFYVLGSVLLAGAAVLLITKKRMSAEV